MAIIPSEVQAQLSAVPLPLRSIGVEIETSPDRLATVGQPALGQHEVWTNCPREDGLTQFSIITTEESTTIPKSIAPSESKLAAMPKCSMPEKANNMERGIANATINAARRFPRNINKIAITSKPPSNRLERTVSITKSTNSVRS